MSRRIPWVQGDGFTEVFNGRFTVALFCPYCALTAPGFREIRIVGERLCEGLCCGCAVSGGEFQRAFLQPRLWVFWIQG